MQCQEEYLPGQILQKHVMQCWFLTNCWILVDHGSNHIVILIDFLHPPVTWHLFPQSEFDTSSKADVYPRPRLDTWRTALPSGHDVNICWNSVGILLVIPTGDSHWFSHFHPFPQGFRWISEDFPALARGWPCCPDANQTKGTARWIQRRLCA